MESGAIVKCLPLSARRGRDTERGLPQLLESLSKGRTTPKNTPSMPRPCTDSHATTTPVIPLKIAIVPPPHRHSCERTSPRTTIRGRNPSSGPCHQSLNNRETNPLFIPSDEGGTPHDIFPTHPPTPVIAMKIGSGKPVVGATLVVARPRRQPIFIPLCGLHKAMVIPNAAKRSEESKILALPHSPPMQYSPLSSYLCALRALRGESSPRTNLFFEQCLAYFSKYGR